MVALNGYAALGAKQGDGFFVFTCEYAAGFIHGLNHPDGPALEIEHGGGEEIAGDEASAFVHVAVESLIRIGIGNIAERLGLKDMPHDARGRGDANLRGAERDFGPEVIGDGVVEEDRSAFGAEEA